LPTPEELLAVWSLCDLDLEKTENEYSKALVLWYYDRWLPVVAGKEYWDSKVRHYQLPTDKVEINGKKKSIITVATEAFGVLMMDNCHSKWIATFNWQKDDPKRKIPSKGTDYDQFKAKYSDSKCGQITFGGWDPKAFEALVKFMEAIKADRKADNGNNKVQQKYAHKLARQAHNIVEKEPRLSRRRKGKEASAPTAKKLKVIVDSDDEDDE